MMKTKSFFNTMMLAVCCLGSAVFVSCDKNDDNKPTTLKFSTAKVEVAPTATSSVTIGNGTQPFMAKSSDEKIATVKVDKNMLIITGIKEGKATIVVTDKNKLSGNLPVNVVTPLAFDKSTVNVGVGKEEVVTVTSGTAPYTVSVKDKRIAAASIKDSKITIKGVKAGNTTITVVDKNKVAGMITVTIK